MQAPGFIHCDVCKQAIVADWRPPEALAFFVVNKFLDRQHSNFYVDACTRDAKNLTN